MGVSIPDMGRLCSAGFIDSLLDEAIGFKSHRWIKAFEKSAEQAAQQQQQ